MSMIYRDPVRWYWHARSVDVGKCPSCGGPIVEGQLVSSHRRLDRWVPGEVRHRLCLDEGDELLELEAAA